MNENRTTSQMQKLAVERERLGRMLKRLRKALKAGVDPDWDEGDPDLVEQEKMAALVRSLEHKLAALDHALCQAQRGKYGVCECCHEPIDPARLEAIPETLLCLQCKMIAEQQIRTTALTAQV